MYDPVTLQLLPVGGQQGLVTIGPVSVARPREPIDPDSLPLVGQPIVDRLSIPNGAYDYSLASLGIQRIERSNLENEFRLYGSGVSAKSLAPGRTVDVTLLWQALRAPSGDRVVFVQMVDKDGALWRRKKASPPRASIPPASGSATRLVRDIHTLSIPGDVADGVYRLEAGMYDPSGVPLTVLRLTRRSLDHVDLGPVEVRGRARTQDVPPVQFTVDARVGNVGKLLGFDLCANSVACAMTPGGPVCSPRADNLNLRLYWQAAEPTSTSYTVFAHLLGPDGRVVSQEDTVPGRGSLPTTSWARGEVLAGPITMQVPANAAPGFYQIEVACTIPPPRLACRSGMPTALPSAKHHADECAGRSCAVELGLLALLAVLIHGCPAARPPRWRRRRALLCPRSASHGGAGRRRRAAYARRLPFHPSAAR